MASENIYLTKEYLTEYMAEYEKNYSKLIFERQEENYKHNTAEWGLWVYDCLKNHDTDSMIQALNSIKDNYQPGKLSKNDFRSTKNLLIILISVMAHYAVRDRIIDNELAMSACDVCISMCEAQTDRESLLKATYAGLVKLSELMQEYSERKYHPLVTQAKEYIYQHLHDEIRVSTMAGEFNVSPEYLSRTFHDAEKITLKEFIILERIHRSRNLLKYSDFTISDISNYLAFSSPSHFAAAFKKTTGKSPTQYRKEVREVNAVQHQNYLLNRSNSI